MLQPRARPPSVNSAERRAGGGGRGASSTCLKLLLLWAAAAAVVYSLGSTLQPGGASAPAAELLARLSVAGEGGGEGGDVSGSQAVTSPAGAPPAAQLPQHKFLMFFSGHQGSSALADLLGSAPAVFVPGFEPLDAPGLTPAQKLAFLEAAFAFPAADAASSTWAAWRAALSPPVPGLRVNRAALRQGPATLAGKSVAGFKMRPYTFSEDGCTDTNSSSSGACGNASTAAAAGGKGHTAMTGLDRAAVRELLRRHNVSVLLTMRQNSLKEALSWHKARDLGVSQFTAIKATKSSGSSGSGGSAGAAAAAAAASQGQQQRRLAVDIPRVLHWLNYTARVNGELREAAAFFGRPTLTVTYEDFLTDPLGETRRAASFVGVPAEQALRVSTKFQKAGPDAIEDWVANLGELCRALEGTPHYQHLNSAACAAADAPEGSGRGGGSSRGAVDASGAATAADEELLDSWCLPQDLQATAGWAALSSDECMRRAQAGQEAAAAAVRAGRGSLLFKHVHKAGGSSLCQLAHANMQAESAPLPYRSDWDTNCVPFQAFLGPLRAASDSSRPLLPAVPGGAVPAALPAAPGAQQPHRRHLLAPWLGGACWLGNLSPPQLRALPQHFRPLTFVASEGPLPDAVPLDSAGGRLAMVTMLRRPIDRVISSYKWWRFMLERMPQAPAECQAYSAPANATIEEWVTLHYPDNWMTRELLGRSALYGWRRRHLQEADLKAAQARLHLFSAVLLLEAPDSSLALLRRRFGWRHADGAAWAAARTGSRADSRAEGELAGQPEVLAALRRRNALDERLYEYAARLHAAQAAATAVGSEGE